MVLEFRTGAQLLFEASWCVGDFSELGNKPTFEREAEILTRHRAPAIQPGSRKPRHFVFQRQVVQRHECVDLNLRCHFHLKLYVDVFFYFDLCFGRFYVTFDPIFAIGTDFIPAFMFPKMFDTHLYSVPKTGVIALLIAATAHSLKCFSLRNAIQIMVAVDSLLAGLFVATRGVVLESFPFKSWCH